MQLIEQTTMATTNVNVQAKKGSKQVKPVLTTEEAKQRFFDNPLINPITERAITYKGPTYNSLVEEHGAPPTDSELQKIATVVKVKVETVDTFAAFITCFAKRVSDIKLTENQFSYIADGFLVAMADTVEVENGITFDDMLDFNKVDVKECKKDVTDAKTGKVSVKTYPAHCSMRLKTMEKLTELLGPAPVVL